MTQTKASGGFWAFLAANFRLQASDFLMVPVWGAAIWAGTTALMAAVSFFAAADGEVFDQEIFSVGVPGIAAMGYTVVMGLLVTVGRVTLEFKTGVQMSVPRRRMLAATAALSAATALETLALAWVLNRLWLILFGRFMAEPVDVLGMMPLWGWLAALVLPVTTGLLSGAIVLRFGAKGGWTLYALFMAACWLPGLVGDRFAHDLDRILPWLLPLLPWLAAAAAAAELIAAVLLLRRIPVND